ADPLWGPLPHPPIGPEKGPPRTPSQNGGGDTGMGVPAAFFYTPVTELQALIRRAFLPISILVALEDGAARDDRGLAVGALHHFAEVEILNRHAVHVVGERSAHGFEFRLADRLGQRRAVVELAAGGLQAGGDDARAVIGLRRVMR